MWVGDVMQLIVRRFDRAMGRLVLVHVGTTFMSEFTINPQPTLFGCVEVDIGTTHGTRDFRARSPNSLVKIYTQTLPL